MFYRLLYKLWKYFWITLGTLVGIFLGLAIFIIVLIQLPPVQNYLLSEVTETFNEQFKGELEIERIGGFLPFQAEVHEGRVYAPGDTEGPVLRFEKATVSISWWELLRQNLTISSLEITRPAAELRMVDDELNFNLAFRQRIERRGVDITDSGTPPLFQRLDIFAPYLSLLDGEISFDESITTPEALYLPSPLNLREINATLFLEVTESQLFADILNLSASIPDSKYEFMQLQGQFFSDDLYVELNRFRIATEPFDIAFSAEATPVNLFEYNLEQQFREAEYRAEIRESSISSDFLKQYAPLYPGFEAPLELEMTVEGSLSELYIDQFQANVDQSAIILSGSLNDLLTEQLSYAINLENMVLSPSQLRTMTIERAITADLERYELSRLRGDLSGNLDSLRTDLNVETEAGSLIMAGNLDFKSPLQYTMSAELDSLDITPFMRDTSVVTMLNGELMASGSGTDLDAEIEASAGLTGSLILGNPFSLLSADLYMRNRELDYQLRAEDDPGELESSGTFTFAGDTPRFAGQGSVSNLDVSRYSTILGEESSRFSGTFSANLQGRNAESLFGRISLEMDESTIGSDTLRAHQLYADIDSPDNDTRTLRFTSSFFDGELSGNLSPALLQSLGSHWADYSLERLREELLFGLEDELTFARFTQLDDDHESSAELSLDIHMKDLELLRLYIPKLPDIASQARMNANLQADRDRISLSVNISDRELRIDGSRLRNLNTTFSAGFRHGLSISEFGQIDLQTNVTDAEWDGMEFKESYANLSVRNDSLQVKQHFVRSDDNALESALNGKLSRGKLEMVINEFVVGSPDYRWVTENTPRVTYTEDGRLTLESFRLTSDNDLVEIDGTFSSSYDDSVSYRLENFDLSRVSDLIGGRIEFSGITNGEFVTRSLTDAPTFQGEITVDDGRILDRVIGDVSLNSIYNSEEDRFDTDVRVYTDPDRYADYLEENDGIGHDLQFTGYFKVPETDDDDFLYFDADLREIDMWIVTFIAPMIVLDMEGSSSGTGFLRASPTDYDFEGVFDITDVHAVPFFTNVVYNLNGELIFNRADGLLFNDIRLDDRHGGTGTLYGQVDLDDFSPETFLDLTLDMNNLEFMDNPPDPDVPFYANLFGTGQARITGSNFSPFLRSVSTINLTSDSRISIPLEEEIEFEQDRRFIQFVDSFDLSLLEQRIREREEAGTNGNEEEELTFVERFTMDLSFAANDPMNVRLIFDPVTNEILNSNGTGQMRILLEDQDLSMFGRYNIQSGDYQFVSGDIFTRRFTLQEGGSISWQGDLIDAGLNVTAVYRARPNISSLLATQAATQQDTGQRIPVELVLQIGGTITEVENDFFFRVPTGVEGTLDPTIATQINNLNQNEELKLIQATSILLSGNFLPYSEAQGLGLGEGITGTSALVTPLLSSQVINPLLSDQINSLLRSDITFDIDLNLTAFNEVDLGVALRLFDDRVILRREGQVTGEQSDIGDLGATYRINRIFSLTAFHRQDPTLSYTSGVETRQSQQMNGLGLEAQVQFNTWQGFRERMGGAIRGMFGIRRDEDEESEEDTDRETDEPATVAGQQQIIRIENISINE